jgi:hypothetical protein
MIGIFSFPLVFIPFKEIYTDPKNIGNYLNNGFYCEFAYDCNKSILWGLLNEFLYIGSAYLMYNIYLERSSLVYQILSTLKTQVTLFLTHILSTYNIITLTSSQQFNFTVYDYCSIVIVTIGSFVYFISPEQIIENNTDENDVKNKLFSNNIETILLEYNFENI